MNADKKAMDVSLRWHHSNLISVHPRSSVFQTAKGANDFAGQVETLAPRVDALVSWLGSVGHGLRSLAGLSV